MKQFADSEAWRAKHRVTALYASFPTDEFETARRFYPRWTGRRDKVLAFPSGPSRAVPQTSCPVLFS